MICSFLGCLETEFFVLKCFVSTCSFLTGLTIRETLKCFSLKSCYQISSSCLSKYMYNYVTTLYKPFSNFIDSLSLSLSLAHTHTPPHTCTHTHIYTLSLTHTYMYTHPSILTAVKECLVSVVMHLFSLPCPTWLVSLQKWQTEPLSLPRVRLPPAVWILGRTHTD